jgi:hypothetical protein
VALSFVLPFVLYTATAARTVQGGDAGEFGLMGLVGGVAHPPGYPVFTLLAGLTGYLPIDPPFFRVALLSVACASGSVAVVEVVTFRVTESLFAAAGAAAALAVSPIFWKLAGVPEAFALHALVVALVLLFSLQLLSAAPRRATLEAAILGGVVGLGLANHQTIVLVIPVAFAAFLRATRGWPLATSVGAGIAAAVALMLGTSPYLLLLKWGSLDEEHAWVWGQTQTIGGLVRHVLRWEYGTGHLFAGGRASPQPWSYVWLSLQAMLSGYVWILFAAGVWGVVVLLRSRTAFGAGLLVSVALSGLVFPLLINRAADPVSVEIAERFFLMPTLLFAPFVGAGLAAARTRVPARWVAAVAGLAIILGGIRSWPKANWRVDSNVERYVVTASADLPRDAVIIGMTDTMRPAMAWRRLVLGKRTDVRYVDAVLLSSDDWYLERVRQELHAPTLPSHFKSIGDFAQAVSRIAPTFLLPDLVLLTSGEVSVSPAGLLWQVRKGDAPAEPDADRDRLERVTAAFGPPSPPTDVWSAHVREELAAPWSALRAAYEKANRPKDAELAAERMAELLPPDSMMARVAPPPEPMEMNRKAGMPSPQDAADASLAP